MTDKPSCPDHPSASVLNAQTSARTRVWCCLACGKRLGPAPEREDGLVVELVSGDDTGDASSVLDINREKGS